MWRFRGKNILWPLLHIFCESRPPKPQGSRPPNPLIPYKLWSPSSWSSHVVRTVYKSVRCHRCKKKRCFTFFIQGTFLRFLTLLTFFLFFQRFFIFKNVHWKYHLKSLSKQRKIFFVPLLFNVYKRFYFYFCHVFTFFNVFYFFFWNVFTSMFDVDRSTFTEEGAGRVLYECSGRPSETWSTHASSAVAAATTSSITAV